MPDQSISSELMVGSDLSMELKILPFNVLVIDRSTLCPDQKKIMTVMRIIVIGTAHNQTLISHHFNHYVIRFRLLTTSITKDSAPWAGHRPSKLSGFKHQWPDVVI